MSFPDDRPTVSPVTPPAEAAGFTLRPATPADTPTILHCIRALAEYERLAHACVATDALLRESLFGERPAAEVVLAYDRETIAGYALWFRSYSTFLARPGIYLEDLFVRPEHRGHGVGKALLQHLASLAEQRGCGRLEWSVLDWNESAIGFYRTLGAIAQDEWTVYRVSGDALHRLATTQVSTEE